MKNKRRFKILKKHHSTTIHFFIRSLFANGLLLLLPLLLVGSYSIMRTTSESSAEAKKQSVSILNQADTILEEFYTHVDNAYLFFSSNPKVSLQLQHAFKEKSLSLDSIQFAENISLNFQNLIYTNDYIQGIYIYYKNDYNRIFAPLNAKILSLSEEKADRIMGYYDHASTEDVWIDFTNQPFLYSEYSVPSLLICRKLYRRTTNVQNGILLFRFHADKLKKELNRFLGYDNQMLFLIDSNTNTVWSSASESSDSSYSDDELLALYFSLKEGTGSPDSKFSDYQAVFMDSPRSYGFSYLLLTPKSEIYETTIHLTGAYVTVIFLAVIAACLLAYFKTRHEYKYLNQIIAAFSDPADAVHMAKPGKKTASSPFEFILMNVIRLFIEQDYLKIQDSEKDAKLKLWKMEALQHQINPHFLHNTLNIIFWESVKLTGSENLCSQMISSLSSIMRYSLSDPQEDVLIKDEIDYVKKYLDIMQLRFPEKFDTEFLIEPECESVSVKKMLLQPLVENSIYHGFREKEEKGLIRISVCQTIPGRLEFTVYDNGMGIPKEQMERLSHTLSQQSSNTHQHIGVPNTNSRLILSYGEESALKIESVVGEFTRIRFTIPTDSLNIYPISSTETSA